MKPNTTTGPAAKPGITNTSTKQPTEAPPSDLVQLVEEEKATLPELFQKYVLNRLMFYLLLVRSLWIIRLVEKDAYVDDLLKALCKKSDVKLELNVKNLDRYSAPFLEWLRRNTPKLRLHKKLTLLILREEPQPLLDVTDDEIKALAEQCGGELKKLRGLYGPNKGQSSALVFQHKPQQEEPCESKDHKPEAIQPTVEAPQSPSKPDPANSPKAGSTKKGQLPAKIQSQIVPLARRSEIRPLVDALRVVQDIITELEQKRVDLAPALDEWVETSKRFKRALADSPQEIKKAA